MATEVAHGSVAEIPPPVPPGAGEVRRMERPLRGGTEPQVPVNVRRDFHLLLEPVNDLNAVVEAVGLVEFFGGRRVLQSPRAVGPDVDFAHRADDAGIKDFFDRAPRGRGMPLVAHLRGQLRVLGGGLAKETGFPDVVGQRLLTIDVLAVRQRQVSGKRVRVLRRGHHDGVEIFRVIEDASEVGELFGLRVSLGRGVQRGLVHIAEHDDVLVRMRRGRPGCGTAAPPFGSACSAARHDGEFTQARVGAPATGDERDVQLVV